MSVRRIQRFLLLIEFLDTLLKVFFAAPLFVTAGWRNADAKTAVEWDEVLRRRRFKHAMVRLINGEDLRSADRAPILRDR